MTCPIWVLAIFCAAAQLNPQHLPVVVRQPETQLWYTLYYKQLGGGARVSEEFQYIDPKPLASASVAQVHRAKLRTGEEVVLKVRTFVIQIANPQQQQQGDCQQQRQAQIFNGAVVASIHACRRQASFLRYLLLLATEPSPIDSSPPFSLTLSAFFLRLLLCFRSASLE